jgi:hypothetical protein
MRFPSSGCEAMPSTFPAGNPNARTHRCNARRKTLKTSGVAGLVMLALSQVAEAKCGTAQLDGTWLLLEPGFASAHEVVISDGTVFTSGSSPLPDFTIRQWESCRVKAGALSGTSEAIPTGSQRRPRTLTLTGISLYFYVLVRK